MSSRYLVISDVDGTLLGDPPAVQRFKHWMAEHGDRVQLVYSSGRFVSSVRRSIEDEELPEPAAILGGVGTEIATFEKNVPIGDWQQRLSAEFSAEDVRSAAREFGLQALQPGEFQSELKVSYFWHDAESKALAEFQECLRRSGVRAQLVYSSQRDLDVLPLGANKGNAARYLAELWGYADEQVLVAGDSNNDRAMFEQGFLGTTVANAANELRHLSGAHIYHARASYADGVVEGLQFWMARRELQLT